VKRSKKLLALLLGLLMLAGLAACGTPAASPTPTNSPADTTQPTATQPTDTLTPDAQPVTITFSRWASGTEQADFDNWIKTYTDAHPNVTVITNYLPMADYQTKLKTDLIAGNAADVIAVDYSTFCALAPSGVFVDLSTLPNGPDVASSLVGGGVTAYQVDGKQYGLPIGVGCRIPFINTDLFTKAGVPIPSQTTPMTATDFVTMLNNLQAGLGSDYMAANLFGDELLDQLCNSIGAPILSADGKTVQSNTPDCIKAIQAWADIMTNKGSVPYDQEWNGPWGTPDSAVSTGKVAICWTGTWSLQAMKDANINYISIPAPIVDGGQPMQEGYINGLAISASSKNQAAAWDFVQWMLSEEQQVAFAQFSDAPANTAASTQYWQQEKANDPNSFGGYLVATATNTWVNPPTGTDFQTLISDLKTKLLTGQLTAQQFAEQLQTQGQPMLDDYLANLS